MKRILYILPGVGLYGGVAVVLQHANRLLAMGYDVSLLSMDNMTDVSWFGKNSVKIFGPKSKEVVSGGFDIVVATHFTTVVAMQQIHAKRHIYFVQSDERRFHDDYNLIAQCEKTYQSVDYEFMTEALWIQRWLKEEFGQSAYYVPNGLDEKIFHPTKQQQSSHHKTRILLEGPINIPFKGMQDAYNAVKDLDCEVWIVSNDGVPPNDWRYEKFFSAVPMLEMKRLYSSCDIFLKMSRVEGFFGPPLEAMACGCAVVVGKCTGYDEYIVDGENAMVVEQGDISGAKKAVQRLMTNEKLRTTLIQSGKKTVKKWSWDYSMDLLQDAIESRMVKVFYDADFPQRYDYKTAMEEVAKKAMISSDNISHTIAKTTMKNVFYTCYRIVQKWYMYCKKFFRKNNA